MDMLLRTDAVNRLLHFAMATIATFHRVGSCWQERVVEEDQSLFQIGREQLAEGLADLPKTPHTQAQFGQFGQGRVRAAAAVEEAVNLVHDLAECAQLRQATGDPAGTLDAIGEFCYRGSIDTLDAARRENLLPLGLARGCVLNREVAIGEPIRYDDLAHLPDTPLVSMRQQQDRDCGVER